MKRRLLFTLLIATIAFGISTIATFALDDTIKVKWGEDTPPTEAVIVSLMSNGEKLDEVELNAENEYKASFSSVPNGNYYLDCKTASFQEEFWLQYKKFSKMYSTRSLKAIKTDEGYNVVRSSPFTDIKGKILWEGDNVIPQSVDVNLIKDGKIIKTKTITKDSEWFYDFGGYEVSDISKPNEELASFKIEISQINGSFTEHIGYDIVVKPTTKVTLTKEMIGNTDEDEFGIYIIPVKDKSTLLLNKWYIRIHDNLNWRSLNWAKKAIDNAKEYDKTSNKIPIYPVLSKLFYEDWLNDILKRGNSLGPQNIVFTEDDKNKLTNIQMFLLAENHLNNNSISEQELRNIDYDLFDDKSWLDKVAATSSLNAFASWDNPDALSEFLHHYDSFDEYVEDAVLNKQIFYTTIKPNKTKTIDIPAEELISLVILEEDYENIKEFDTIYYNPINGDDWHNVRYGNEGAEAKNKFEYTLTNRSEFCDITVTKEWVASNGEIIMPPAGSTITATLYADGKAIQTRTIQPPTTSWTWREMPVYDKNENKINYTVVETNFNAEGFVHESIVKNETKEGLNFKIINKHQPEEFDVEILKTDLGGNELPGANLKIESSDVEGFETISWTSTNTPKKVKLKAGTYTLTETTAPDGYEVAESITFKVTKDGKVLIDNKEVNIVRMEDKPKALEKVSLSGLKIWDDDNNNDGKRPESITVKLLADGEVVKTTTASEETEWKYSFEDLSKYKNNVAISYTIDEEDVSDYEKYIDGLNLKNTHISEKINISGKKTWDDENDFDGLRPDSITVRLFANNEEVRSTVSTDGTYEFTDLPKYKQGKEISYEIKEDKVSNYTTEVNGYNLKNIHKVEKVNISGKKTWNDNNNEDGFRPEKITVNLLANGEKVKSVEVSEDWTYKFTDLPKYKDGSEIVYTISEEPVEKYSVVIDGYNITNTYTPEKVKISGTKTWDDENDTDKIRPSEITVNLLADGEKVNSVKVSKDTEWKYSFENLPKYKNKKEIDYTITEDKVEGYETVIDGYNITNKHKPEGFEVEISKVEVNKTEELPGAKLKIESLDVEGFETISWISTNMTKKVKLKPGTYIMTETTAPDGYEIAESITFTVTEDGKVVIAGKEVDIVRMQDKPKKIIKKTKPVKPTKKVVEKIHKDVKTGDNTQLFTFSFIFVVAIAGIVLIIKRKRTM